MGNRTFAAHVTQSPGAFVTTTERGSWHLEIPANAQRAYRLAQLDDHAGLPRDKFPWRPPLILSLQGRASANDLPGTWGFGFWNEPFSFLIGGDRTARRLPTLPNAAWFFHASPENYLSFRDDLPASGFLAATFSSRKIPTALLALGTPALGLTLLPITAQPVRRVLRSLAHQDANVLDVDVTQWHSYTLEWQPARVTFFVDGVKTWRTAVVPPPPLSMVLWIDNQYAAMPPHNRLRYGTVSNPGPGWLEVREIELQDN